MLSTRKGCLIGFLIWGYQMFYSIPPKNWLFGLKAAKVGPKLVFLAKYGHFWSISSNAWPRKIRKGCLGVFPLYWYQNFCFLPLEFRFLAQKGQTGPKFAFLVMPDQKIMRIRCLGCFFHYPARARAPRACALGLLLADGAPTVGRWKTFWRVN